MEEANYFFLIGFSFLVLLLLWVLIAFNIGYRNYREKKLASIENTFADIVSKHLYGSASEKLSFIEIQRTFRKMGITRKNPENVQYLIDLMIRTQRSLLGRNYSKVEELYKKIPPYRASFRKTQDRRWYIRARGIREIYEMNQRGYTAYVAKFRDDPDVYIRREAQIALVVFLGWESLRFLPYLTKEIELWQQIKIVEKLHDLYPEPQIQYIRKCYEVEHDHGKTLLMRIIRKFGLVEELDFIITNLSHESFEIRETAIYCLRSFQLKPSRLTVVKSAFQGLKNLQQQRQVLALIEQSSPIADVGFYLDILSYHSSDFIKLKVSEVLWNSGYEDLVLEYNRGKELEEVLSLTGNLHEV